MFELFNKFLEWLDTCEIDLNKFDWNGVSGVADIVMLLLTLALVWGLRQGSRSIKEASLSRDADILRWAMSEMDALKPKIKLVTDAYKIREYRKSEDEADPQTPWNEETLKAAQDVSVHLQRIGYMALKNLISRDHFKNIWGPMYLSTWYAMESWVKQKRSDLDEPAELSQGACSRRYFEEYALYCENNLELKLVNNERKRFNFKSKKETSLIDKIKNYTPYL